MLIDFNYLVSKYKLDISGVIHIGAHTGQEYSSYKEHNIPKIMFFEPMKVTYSVLRSNVGHDPSVQTFNVALSDRPGKMKMYTETRNQGQSSSLLRPKKHTEYYPDIVFDGEEEVKVEILDNYNTSGYDTLNIDIQGNEIYALRGSEKTLNHINYIYTEVNREELYEGCTTIDQLDEFLSKFGFIRVETEWTGQGWGDAFFVKKEIFDKNPIADIPDKLKITSSDAALVYPPNNHVIFEEYFASWYSHNADRFNLNRQYIPINWTSYYVKNGYGANIQELQKYLDGLSRDKKYFTVLQYDNGIINKIPGLDIVVFSGGGKGQGRNFPIPLTCQRNNTPRVEKDIFCSFIGRNTNKLREEIFKTKFSDLYYIKESNQTSIEEYMSIMARSTFALCPRGYGLTSFRIAEALSAGAIPVYISDEFWIPFDNFDYGIMIPAKDIHNLQHILNSISYFEVVDQQRKLEWAYKTYFEYEALCNRIVEQLKLM